MEPLPCSIKIIPYHYSAVELLTTVYMICAHICIVGYTSSNIFPLEAVRCFNGLT